MLLSATGASAAIGAAVGLSATMVSVITTVAFSVTGISAKINKAAASVFGEDLVKIGNIFGAAYGAFGGGFAGANAGYGEALGAVEPVASVWEGGASLADMAGGVEAMSGLDAMDGLEGYDGGYNSAEQLAGDAEAIKSMGGEAVAQTAQPENVVERVQRESPMDVANATQKPTNLLQGPASTPPANAAGANAAAPQATASQVQAGAPNAAAPVKAPRSFFDRLVYDDKGNVSTGAMRMGGQVLSGVGQGYTAAQRAKAQQAQFDAEMRMRNQRPGIVVTR